VTTRYVVYFLQTPEIGTRPLSAPIRSALDDDFAVRRERDDAFAGADAAIRQFLERPFQDDAS
jgi:hypothetical protein